MAARRAGRRRRDCRRREIGRGAGGLDRSGRARRHAERVHGPGAGVRRRRRSRQGNIARCWRGNRRRQAPARRLLGLRHRSPAPIAAADPRLEVSVSRPSTLLSGHPGHRPRLLDETLEAMLDCIAASPSCRTSSRSSMMAADGPTYEALMRVLARRGSAPCLFDDGSGRSSHPTSTARPILRRRCPARPARSCASTAASSRKRAR